jgi:hypothetical protein
VMIDSLGRHMCCNAVRSMQHAAFSALVGAGRLWTIATAADKKLEEETSRIKSRTTCHK